MTAIDSEHLEIIKKTMITKTLKEKIEKKLEKIILDRFPGEDDIVQFSERELIKTILSLISQEREELAGGKIYQGDYICSNCFKKTKLLSSNYDLSNCCQDKVFIIKFEGLEKKSYH